MPRVTAGAVELYYESLGEGTTMVLQAHDHTPWLFGQAPVFSQRYRVLTYDRRGTGRSSSPPGPWTAADLANDLAAFLDALGVEKAIVGGSSLGGVVTAQFAVDHPGRALALIVGHTVPYLDPEGEAWLEREIEIARSGGAAIVNQPRSSADEKEGPPTTDPAFASMPWAKMMAATGTGLGRTPEERATAIAVLRGWDQRPRKADLAKIDVPTLVIVGENEPRTTIEGSREWASWIPGARFVILPGAHHAAPREAAPAWNATVQRFLDENGLGARPAYPAPAGQ
jgi:pimeloyl-ACP methyl ester carboxylesterase